MLHPNRRKCPSRITQAARSPPRRPRCPPPPSWRWDAGSPVRPMPFELPCRTSPRSVGHTRLQSGHPQTVHRQLNRSRATGPSGQPRPIDRKPTSPSSAAQRAQSRSAGKCVLPCTFRKTAETSAVHHSTVQDRAKPRACFWHGTSVEIWICTYVYNMQRSDATPAVVRTPLTAARRDRRQRRAFATSWLSATCAPWVGRYGLHYERRDGGR